MEQTTPLEVVPQAGRTLAERELGASLGWMIGLRWIAGGGVLIATWATGRLLALQLAAGPLYAIGASILGYNIFFWWMLRRAAASTPRANRLAHLQIASDWMAMTLLIHFSGGAESPAILYFFFHTALASILLSWWATYLYAILATCLVGGTFLLEYSGLLPHVAVPGLLPVPLYQQPAYVGGVLFFFTSAMFVVTYLATRMTTRLRRREAEVLELSHRLQHAYGRLQTLYEGAQVASSTLDLQQVLNRLVEGTAKAMEVRACSVRLMDETGARLRVAAVYGLSQSYVQKGDLTLERNPLAREALAGKAVIVADVTTEPRLQFPAEALAEGIRSTLTVPLQGKSGPLGLIRAYSTEANGFTSDDGTFLSAIAGQGSIAIENAMAYQKLAALEQMKSKFALTVTHELRSPVSVVQSLLRTMVAGYAGVMSDAQRDIASRALHRAEFLQTLIDDLLDLASGKSDASATEDRVAVALDEAVERVVKRFEVLAHEKQIALEWQCREDDRPIKVLATSDGVDRVLNNLVSNAIKYTPGGGRVWVTLRRAGFASL
ncbi:MAG TPA: GAF domain-containing sensor histidine kinase, partial [Candidatus Methylomirabilis sp.]|nr:GAF domain-containing sensor histidine kinase [Candidatus Methylomirabilis sp.]